MNSVTGEEASLETVLPLVKEHGLPVIGLTLDEKGIPADADTRVAIAQRIVERAEALGIPREDVIIDCLTLSLGANVKAGLATLEATRRVRDELGCNQTQGCSNISHGLPNRPVLNGAYLAIAIEAGLTCPTVDAALVRLAYSRPTWCWAATTTPCASSKPSATSRRPPRRRRRCRRRARGLGRRPGWARRRWTRRWTCAAIRRRWAADLRLMSSRDAVQGLSASCLPYAVSYGVRPS